ncbi:ABC transporter permease [Demequina lutea]|uniref:Putative ABC transport system permease protein n=1 Tax=Demequina lutea TaxID=431489 RepID=A0A7Y9Z761_9MICO|nr:ABC transporter permease [Demequina lutea]NYI40062.1 putative ABC transport system permease protein [Demequina lutea]
MSVVVVREEPAPAVDLGRSRVRLGDLAAVAASAMSSRRMRTLLSALGVTIGIASMVAVLGLSDSSRADLQTQIGKLGTNLLTIQAGSGFGAGDATLPDDVTTAIARIGPIENVTGVVTLTDPVLRNSEVNVDATGGVQAVAADLNLLATLNSSVADGVWLNAATSDYPAVVLGATAAQRLGVTTAADGQQILIGGKRFTVVGILNPFPLAADLDRSAIIGTKAAVDYLGATLAPSTVYVTTVPAFVDNVQSVLAATANPEHPENVQVTRPSDALEAQKAANNAFTALFLGLGAVALLVGGVGIANVMIMGVVERRAEIGLRRALGATRGHIRDQFLIESLMLAGLGGVAGVALGALATFVYATSQGWQTVIPPIAIAGGLGGALVIGAVAGLYPAMRAAALAPTEALRS